MKLHLVAFAISAIAVPGFGRIVTTTPPKGLTFVDWKQIRAEYERHRHGMFPVAATGGFQARSFEQQWLAHFDGRGVLVTPNEGAWRWGLELAGVAGKAKVTTAVNRITYRWSANLEEWYLNDTRGLEHGFTLHGPQAEIRLRVRGGLQPRATDEGIVFADGNGAARMKYTSLAAWDAERKAVPVRLSVREGQVVFTVDDRGARYPITIDPAVQQAYLKASNTDTLDNFGYRVAASGDTVVVTASRESSLARGVNGNQSDNSKLSSGAAYVFVRSGSTWSQQAYLKASNTDSQDAFGTGVAISGDTIVVGANSEDSSATGVNGNQNDNGALSSGAAYVFVRSGTAWSQQAYLKASNTGTSDFFGSAVAISGDTIVVGAPGEASNATGINGNQSDDSMVVAGAAYVFVRSGTTWAQQAYLKASNTESASLFGAAVAISGDTVVASAYRESGGVAGVNGNQADKSKSKSGAVYVFTRNGATWAQQAFLKASNPDVSDEFGGSLAISGDTIVVGATGEDSAATGINGNQSDNSASDSGAVYVFVRNGTTWSQQAYLKASNSEASDGFGSAVAISGETIAVGASTEDSGAAGIGGNQSDNSTSAAGAVYVFVRSGASWTQQTYVKASNPGFANLFGSVIALSGETLVVGAFQEESGAVGVDGNQNDNSKSQSGAAYVFKVPPTIRSVTTSPSPAVAGQSFTVTVTGDGFDPATIQADLGQTQLLNSQLSNKSATQFSATLTLTSAGSYPIVVRNGPLGLDSLPFDFSVASPPSPVVLSIATSPAPAVGGQQFTLTVNGSNFVPNVAQIVVNGTAQSNSLLTVKTTTQLAMPLTLAAGSYSIAARDELTGLVSNTVTLNVASATPLTPVLTTMTTNPTPPLSGQTFTLTINGSNFDPATAIVFVGSTQFANSVLSTKTSSQLVLPVTVFGTGAQQVTVKNGANGTASNALTLSLNTGIPSQGSYFVPISPCRAADTRVPTVNPIAGKSSRDFTFSACNIPSNATAVALNVTLVPSGQLGYISIWPAGQSQPVVSTMNSLDGRIKANSAIVGLGTSGAISVYVTDTAHVILDVNGYFVPPGTSGGLAFYPVTPCRVTDTRNGGGGVITAKTTRRVAGGGSCLPASAQAYSLNVTVVPKGPLGFLTLWPDDGSAQPTVSTLNALTGTVVANAAILRTGTGGAFNAYVTDDADMVVDLNGYFAAPGQPGALAFYPLAPCRIFDTRATNGAFGGPSLAADSTRSFTVTSSSCNVPGTAQAYVTNATMLPPGVFGFLTLFPGSQARPTVSTLNAIDGALTSNAAIVPAGTGGVIQVYTSDATHMLLDISGYFAP